jgi:hypothetical protein
LSVFLYSILENLLKICSNPNEIPKPSKETWFFIFNFLEKFIKDMFNRTMHLKLETWRFFYYFKENLLKICSNPHASLKPSSET